MYEGQRDRTGMSLEETKRLYKPLFDCYPEPTVVHDGRQVIVANVAACEFSGVAVFESGLEFE